MNGRFLILGILLGSFKEIRAPILNYLAFRTGKKVVERAPGMALEGLKAVGSDQLAAGLFVTNTILHVTINMVSPIIQGGICYVGGTVARTVLAATAYVQTRLKNRKAMADGTALVAEGVIAAIPLIRWFNENDHILVSNPVEAVTILQAVMTNKTYELLDLVISKTKEILMGKRMQHQLYCALMLDPKLPTKYLLAALGDEPDRALGPEWWINEFMSSIVTFPEASFHDYLQLFFQTFTSPNHNAVLTRIKIPVISPKFPHHVQLQMTYIKYLHLYYILENPKENANIQLLTKDEPKPLEALRSLEFYLELSGFMRLLHDNPKSEQVANVIHRINDFIKDNDITAKDIVSNDMYRLVKIITKVPTNTAVSIASLQDETIALCSAINYSVLLPLLVKSKIKDEEMCAELDSLRSLYRVIPRTKVQYRCAEIVAIPPLTAHIDPNVLRSQEQVSMDRKIIIAGMILEFIFNIDRDYQNLKKIASDGNSSVESIVNNAIGYFCKLYKKWPQTLLKVAKGKSTYTSVDEFSARTDQVPDVETHRPEEELMDTLVSYVKTDAQKDFIRVLKDSLQTDKLGFEHYAKLVRRIINMADAMDLRRKSIFTELMDRIVAKYKHTHLKQLWALLEEIRANKLFRKLVRKHNLRSLGLMK